MPSQRPGALADALERVNEAFTVYDPQLGQLWPLLDPLGRDALSVAHPAASKVSSNKIPRHVSLVVFGIVRLLSAIVGRGNLLNNQFSSRCSRPTLGAVGDSAHVYDFGLAVKVPAGPTSLVGL